MSKTQQTKTKTAAPAAAASKKPAPPAAPPIATIPKAGKTGSRRSTAPATAAKAAPAKKPATAAAPTAEIVTAATLAKEVALAHGMAGTQAKEIVEGMFASISGHLAKGSKIRVAEFGIMEAKDRAARTGRNPATGQVVEIPASRKVVFRPAKSMRDAV